MVDRTFRDQIRALGEDTVSYAIYVPLRLQGTDVERSAIADSQATFDTLRVAKALALSLTQRLTKGYIWNQDAFSLRIDSGKRLGPDQGEPCLRGRTRFGDCLDDEWMVVYLLREITRHIPGSVARVWDNDGDFLLIEAADHIPSWLTPETSENRVYIYDGDLHIVPLPAPSEQEKDMAASLGSRTAPPKLGAALNFIRRANVRTDDGKPTTKTLASPNIQQAAFSPLTEGFARRKIQEQKHYARCRVPLVVAKLLKVRPELVTRACNAFYTRDALGLAACGRMQKFLPLGATASKVLPPAEAQKQRIEQARMVTTAVCFTKTCYAQLVSQPFQPPKSWDGIVPPPDPQDARDPQKVREAELGMKLTCGFEILCSPDYPGDFGRRLGEEIKLEDYPFTTDYDWKVFKNALSFRRYFGEERPGSQEYRRLEEQAKRQFLEAKMERDREELQYSKGKTDQGSTDIQLQEDADNADLEEHTSSFFGHGYHPIEEIDTLLSRWAGEEQEVDAAEQYVDDRPSDDDSWMTVSLADLEAMMHAKGLRDPSLAGTRDGDNDDGVAMEDVLGKFESFVEQGQGGIEGAEFLDEQSDEDTDSDNDSDVDDLAKRDDKEDGFHDENFDDDDDEEDIFASDYEERVAERRARKSKKKDLPSASQFIFEDYGSSTSMKVDDSNDVSQRFTVNMENVQRILADQFGVTRSTLLAQTSSLHNNGNDDTEEEDDSRDQDIRKYMKELDAELAQTTIGESFERTVPVEAKAQGQKKDKGKAKAQDEEETYEHFVALDQKATNINSSTRTKTTQEAIEESIARTKRSQTARRGGPIEGWTYGYDPLAGGANDSSDEEQDTRDGRASKNSTESRSHIRKPEEDNADLTVGDVNIDLNLAKNLLESFRSQGGLPGPGSNLLGRLGVVLPRDEDSDEYDEVAHDEESDDGDPRY
ncbi:hypothetical protein BGW42_001449 [Actinomortierella wolfii]|nr:hypothetical protein BGW42_001449 [Actinomortierella wolfii]